MAKQATLSAISKDAGCSKAVASKVLNGSRGNVGVSEQMRRRVEAAARRLGYRPNFASQSLALKRTRTIGVYIMPTNPWGGAGRPYESAILQGAEQTCQQAHYDLLLINLAGSADPVQCINKIAERRVDGVLVLRADGQEHWVERLAEQTRNLVLVDCIKPVDRIDAVTFDNDEAMRMAVEHLAGLGHRRIGYLGTCTRQTIPHNEARQRAFVAAVREAGLALDERWMFGRDSVPRPVDLRGGNTETVGQMVANYFGGLAEDGPTGMIVYNNVLAAEAVKSLMEAGWSIPSQMSFVNVEDTMLSRYLTPSLTSLRHPLTEMGRRAAELLISKAEAQSVDAPAPACRHEVFAPELVVRQSTAPPADAS